MSGFFAAIATAFSGAGAGAVAGGAAAGAAGAAVGGSFIQTLVGGALTGLASGLMMQSQFRMEQKAAEAEDRRRMAHYEGAGEAMETGLFRPGVGLGAAASQPVGEIGKFGNPDQVGQKYSASAQARAGQKPGQNTQPKRYRYNPQTAAIELT